MRRKRKQQRTYAQKPALYSYVERPIGATPGAGNFAFLPGFGLPLFSTGGAGIGYYKQWGTQPPQIYYGQAQRIDGLQGVFTPNIQPQPLVDMDQHIANLSAMAAQAPQGAAQLIKE